MTLSRILHRCWITGEVMEAINECVEEADGGFWVGNGEYSSYVNFCPICGLKAPKQVPADKWGRDT